MSRPRKKESTPNQKDIDYYHRKIRATHCSNGHRYTTESSLYVYHSQDGKVIRRCRECRNIYYKAYYNDNLREYRHWSELLIGGV